MANEHILFISYDGMTDPLGQSQVIPYLVGLTKFGYTFTILSCDKPLNYAENKTYVDQLLAPYPIRWVSLPYHKYPPILSSWFDYRMLLLTALQLHQKTPFDAVHTRVGIPALVGHRLKQKKGIRFLNDIRGFWADERMDGGMWNADNIIYQYIYRFFKKKEYQFINEADYNTCLTFAAKKAIQSWPQIHQQPIEVEVIPCSADMELFNAATISEISKNDLRLELGLTKDNIIISYLGSIGGWYLTAEMMRFCKLVSDKLPQARFLFISPHLHPVISSEAARYGLNPELLIIRKAKRHEVPALLSLSTYSLFFIKPCFSKISSSPTKHGEIMAMGIPVITNDGVGDVASIVKQFNAGYVVGDFSEASMQEVVNQLGTDPGFDGQAIRQGAIDFCSLDAAVKKYSTVYSRMFKPERSAAALGTLSKGTTKPGKKRVPLTNSTFSA